ncbi:MAG: hypothetical protein H6719_38115, partial [Sandaracinaceae bacterium]|nr:hypothetical protein [Sandaracinaceae bacterium]
MAPPQPAAPLLMCSPTGQYLPEPAPRVDARAALADARRLAASGDPARAALRLRAVAEAEPDVADRIA